MTHRIIAWLAIVGIAFNALWPLVANAAPVDVQAAICTAVKAPGEPLKKIPAGSASPHCPFCLGVSDSTPALPSTQTTAFATVIMTLSAIIAGTASAGAFNHPSAVPRGPPTPP
jgi:hypothetical protein